MCKINNDLPVLPTLERAKQIIEDANINEPR